MNGLRICDFHVHVGEKIGGYRLRDGFEDIDKIAGLKGIGAFVTEEPSYPLARKLADMRRDAEQNFSGKVYWHLTPLQTTTRELSQILAADTDIKLYTTYRAAGLYRSYADIERFMQELSDMKPRFLVHCEDNAVIEEASAKYPFNVPYAHSLRRPELAEIIAVDMVLELAVKHDYPVHIVHVSSPRAAKLIREAKKHNPQISCETAPHYLLLNSEALNGENAHRLICSPPFRAESSRGQMIELLQDRYFDIIATDHCAFSAEDKDRYKDEPAKVPCGIAGLQDLSENIYKSLVESGIISEDYLDELIYRKPAQMMGFD